MPPLPPVPDVVKLTLNYDNSPVGGFVSKAANIFHLQYPPGILSGFTTTNMTSIANGAMTWWGTHFKPSITSYWRLYQVTATAVDGTGNQGFSTSAASSGSASPPALVPQAAITVSWLGAPAHRGGRPRTYLPGCPESAITTGTSQILSAFASTLRTAGEAARLDMAPFTISSNTPAMVYVSYYNKTLFPTPPHLRINPVVYAIQGTRVHERLDSQRRRSGKEVFFPSA